MNFPRVFIAGTGSGCGKTTVVAALLSALRLRGMNVQPFKCGPDFIDPMFHTAICGRVSRNLDSFFMEPEVLSYLFCKNAAGARLSVIEGVMGYYDGLFPDTDQASTAQLAAQLRAPCVLVVNARGMSLSAAALVKGFRALDRSNTLQGVILNWVNRMGYERLKPVIEQYTGLPCFGYFPSMPECSLESRHLGLITAREVEGLEEKLDRLGHMALTTLDLERLLRLADSAPPLTPAAPAFPPLSPRRFRLAVARDPAFCFYYQDNLELLQTLGAEILPFSPLEDAAVPAGAQGIYFGGGYPELYARRLAENSGMIQSIRFLQRQGVVLFAECGGFVYLCRSLETATDGQVPLCGVIPSDVQMTASLKRFGYVTLTADKSGLLGPAGTQVRGHEFHYSDGSENGGGMRIHKPSGKSWRGVHLTDRMAAGYPHIHFWSNPKAAYAFADACRQSGE